MMRSSVSNKEVQIQEKAEALKTIVTCPICNRFFKDATSIGECLHTFCRKCISKKIIEENLQSCPVCNKDIGCAPLEKLRSDHDLRDMRTNIKSFYNELKKGNANVSEAVIREVKEPEVVASVPLSTRRKERSLSSLVSSPSESNHTGTTRRRKHSSRKARASRGSTFSIEEPVKIVEERPESSTSVQTLNKIDPYKKQNASVVESSKQQMPNKTTTEKRDKPLEGMNDLLRPLNSLAEAAGITMPYNSDFQGSVSKSAVPNFREDEARMPKSKNKESGSNLKGQEYGKGKAHVPSGSVNPKKMNRGKQKITASSEGFSIPAQAIVDATSQKCKGIVNPIWLSLVASDKQEGNAPLPQIPSRYLKIKDVHIPVSFIKKYLVQKLNLVSEDEVEIYLRGQPLIPTLQLHNLLDLWAQTAPTAERIKTYVGSSAKDFVMVLSYGRKA